MEDLQLLESRLKVLLAERKMSSKQFANLLGVSVQSVTNWSKGYNNPPIETLFRISRVLNCKVDDLFTYIEDEE